MLTRASAWARHQAKRLLGRPTVPPPVHGVADATWYDAAYRAIPSYGAPYWESHYYFLWSVLADRVRQADAKIIVDIGCGPGQFAACLLSLVPGIRYVGLDYSAEAVRMAREACPGAEFLVGDATSTDIHALPHDITICTEVLEHVTEDHQVIERFRPGVRALCTVPNFPYQSHVRHFKDAGEVHARYERWFDRLDVWPLRGSRDHVYFLMDGRRREDNR